MRELLAALALAWTIAGEAPTCPPVGKLAVAHVAQRNPVWAASARPAAEDVAIALVWRSLPDPTGGAQYLIGPGDAQHPAMERLLAGRTNTLHVACGGSDFVEAWK